MRERGLRLEPRECLASGTARAEDIAESRRSEQGVAIGKESESVEVWVSALGFAGGDGDESGSSSRVWGEIHVDSSTKTIKKKIRFDFTSKI